MGKKGKKGPRLALKQASTKDEKPNLFERMFNRKKFDVLGKKAKGQQRKLGQSRSEAVEKVRSHVTTRGLTCVLHVLGVLVDVRGGLARRGTGIHAV